MSKDKYMRVVTTLYKLVQKPLISGGSSLIFTTYSGFCLPNCTPISGWSRHSCWV